MTAEEKGQDNEMEIKVGGDGKWRRWWLKMREVGDGKGRKKMSMKIIEEKIRRLEVMGALEWKKSVLLVPAGAALCAGVVQ